MKKKSATSTKSTTRHEKAESRKPVRLCDENCNECPVIGHPNYRMVTVILNALYELYGESVYSVVQHYCPNMTVCADCRIDDFCHFREGCELLDEAQRYAKEEGHE